MVLLIVDIISEKFVLNGRSVFIFVWERDVEYKVRLLSYSVAFYCVHASNRMNFIML